MDKYKEADLVKKIEAELTDINLLNVSNLDGGLIEITEEDLKFLQANYRTVVTLEKR